MSLSNQTFEFDVEYVFDEPGKVEVSTPEEPLGIILRDGSRILAAISDNEIQTVCRDPRRASPKLLEVAENEDDYDAVVLGTVVMAENSVTLTDLVLE